jgi:hypothetical protein
MRIVQTYEVKMLDGTKYQGEITYRDKRMVVLKLPSHLSNKKLRLYNHGILSIRELGWKKHYSYQDYK